MDAYFTQWIIISYCLFLMLKPASSSVVLICKHHLLKISMTSSVSRPDLQFSTISWELDPFSERTI